MKKKRVQYAAAGRRDRALRVLIGLFFTSAAALFMYTPTRWFMQTFRGFDAYRDVSLTPEEGTLRASSNRVLRSDPDAPRKITFRLLAPGAERVDLVGEFNDFKRGESAMSRRPDGVWEAALELAPGTYLYRFLVDGEPVLDPTNRERVEEPEPASVLRIRS